MTFHNNQLREIPLFDAPADEPTRSAPRDVPRASKDRHAEYIKGFVKQEETPDKKRKRDETLKFQSRHDQPAVDAAQGAGMDLIDLSEPFNGFNFTSANAYMRNDHFHVAGNQAMAYSKFYGYDNNRSLEDLDHGCAFFNPNMLDSSVLAQSLSGDTLVGSSFVPDSFSAGESIYSGATNEGRPEVKHEDAHEFYPVSATPAEDSDFLASESEEERPSKIPKINKDGAPRKPRQPRPKLLKWNDDDWKNVCLGIVWACGETGVQIPFDQAAQIVGEKCTAGALQQALLKLRGKQIADGHQIPNLKMAWTRKNKHAGPDARANSSQEPEANRPRKKPTRMEATQSYIVTLPRAYKDQARQGMAYPYKWKKPPRKARSSVPRRSADVKQGDPTDRSTTSLGFMNDVPQYQDDLGAFSYAQPAMVQKSQPSLLSRLFQRGSVARGSGTLTPNPAGDIHGDSAIYDFASEDTDFLPTTPTGAQFYNSPPATPFGNNTGYLQGMAIGGGEFADLLNTEGLHEFGNGFADATDDVFITP